jgi:alpha-L-fucosidase
MAISKRKTTLFSLVLLAMSFCYLPTGIRSQTANQNAPTASTDPERLDEIWQNASRKYDAARTAILQSVDEMNRKGPFRADWQSLESYRVPDWYKDAKFGIFIHWGVYSVPAYGSEWYPREMYTSGTDEYKHHIAVYGPLDRFGYKDFIPRFTAEKFDAGVWAR